MITRAADAPAPGADTSLSALTYIHNLLCRPAAEQDGLPALLAELATAFDAQAVELRPVLEEAGHIRVGARQAGNRTWTGGNVSSVRGWPLPSHCNRAARGW